MTKADLWLVLGAYTTMLGFSLIPVGIVALFDEASKTTARVAGSLMIGLTCAAALMRWLGAPL